MERNGINEIPTILECNKDSGNGVYIHILFTFGESRCLSSCPPTNDPRLASKRAYSKRKEKKYQGDNGKRRKGTSESWRAYRVLQYVVKYVTVNASFLAWEEYFSIDIEKSMRSLLSSCFDRRDRRILSLSLFFPR